MKNNVNRANKKYKNIYIFKVNAVMAFHTAAACNFNT